ncbi:hypothetical protein [Pelagovum pacificum]|uniref:hypothetical protein n=1 Tax=Pelagovum pacificum TaxID=2588711 RepID=UPI0018CCE0BB|nr:hypothetical protein [Pelagovum pacificum]QQA41887.1 hypothetical protein I8N54_13920 [Pelagovum pacificum]
MKRREQRTHDLELGRGGHLARQQNHVWNEVLYCRVELRQIAGDGQQIKPIDTFEPRRQLGPPNGVLMGEH